jgi:MFS family permease
VYTESKYSLQNWVEQLDLVCTPNDKIGWFGSGVSAGSTITCLLIPPISDKKGRKLVFLICMTL